MSKILYKNSGNWILSLTIFLKIFAVTTFLKSFAVNRCLLGWMLVTAVNRIVIMFVIIKNKEEKQFINCYIFACVSSYA